MIYYCDSFSVRAVRLVQTARGILSSILFCDTAQFECGDCENVASRVGDIK